MSITVSSVSQYKNGSLMTPSSGYCAGAWYPTQAYYTYVIKFNTTSALSDLKFKLYATYDTNDTGTSSEYTSTTKPWAAKIVDSVSSVPKNGNDGYDINNFRFASGRGAYSDEYTITKSISAGDHYLCVYSYKTYLTMGESNTASVSTSNIVLSGTDQPGYYVTVGTVSGDSYISSVSGSGTYVYGQSCTVTAVLPANTSEYNYSFDGWYYNNSKVSSSISYTFSVTGSITILAKGSRTSAETAAPVVGTITALPSNPASFPWSGIYLQSYTRASISFNYTLASSDVTLSSITVTCNGDTVTGTISGSSPTYTFNGTSPVIAGSGDLQIIATVIDSKSKSGSNTATITVLPYSKPYLTSSSALRYSTDVDTEDLDNGTYISAKATLSYQSVGGRNQAYIKARYREAGGSFGTSVASITSGALRHVDITASGIPSSGYTIDTEKSYSVQFLVYDSLHAYDAENPTENDPTVVEVLIPTKTVTISCRDGGGGFSVGGYNTLDAFQVWMKTYLYNNMILSGSSGIYGDRLPQTGSNGQLFFLTSGSSGWQTVTPYIYLDS